MPANSTNALDVAAAIVERIHPIDPLKLQKLVFYAAGEYAALTGERMFPEELEAWEYGPAVYDLWKAYRTYDDDRAIVKPRNGDPSHLNDLAIGCVDSTIRKYGNIPGPKLITLTHKEPAWQDAYVQGQWRTKIPFATLIESFRKKETTPPSDELLDRVFAAQSRAS
ncbi:MAG: type II toxin-antitoxin system antitoxin SocA domain-containing protein [Acidimicrobiales bacterium]